MKHFRDSYGNIFQYLRRTSVRGNYRTLFKHIIENERSLKASSMRNDFGILIPDNRLYTHVFVPKYRKLAVDSKWQLRKRRNSQTIAQITIKRDLTLTRVRLCVNSTVMRVTICDVKNSRYVDNFLLALTPHWPFWPNYSALNFHTFLCKNFYLPIISFWCSATAQLLNYCAILLIVLADVRDNSCCLLIINSQPLVFNATSANNCVTLTQCLLSESVTR